MQKHPKTVLIVEDEASLRRALREKFSHEQFEVLEAANGADGLAVALREHPDLILLDIIMPRMDGIEMARQLRKDAWGKHVSIIILSNLSDTKQIQAAMENDVFEYFVKTDTTIESVSEKAKHLLGLD